MDNTPVRARTTARIPSPTGLYWSERGHIGCAAHTPYEGSDTWIWERWEPVPVAAIAEAKRLGRDLRCETCHIGPEKSVGHPGLRIHDCRHIWAATMLRAGVPPNDLAHLGGWSSLAMVSRYARHVPQNAGDRARERLQALIG